VVVDVHDGDLTVKPDNLKPIDEPECVVKCLLSQKKNGSGDCVIVGCWTELHNLESLEDKRNEMEDKVLTFLEQQYKISE